MKKSKFSPTQIARAKELEANISQYLTGADLALASVIEYHSNKLYLIEFSSFEECAEKLWQISRSRAYQLLNYAKHVKQLSDDQKPQQIESFDVHNVDTLTNEGQFRNAKKITQKFHEVESTVTTTENHLPCSIPASTPSNLKPYLPNPAHIRKPSSELDIPTHELRFADKQSLIQAVLQWKSKLSQPNTIPPPPDALCDEFLHLINEHLSS